MLKVVRVLIHMPDVRNIFLLEICVDALADPNQTVFVAAGDIEQFQLFRRLVGVGHEFNGRFRIWRRRETTYPRKSVEIGQSKIERLTAAH